MNKLKRTYNQVFGFTYFACVIIRTFAQWMWRAHVFFYRESMPYSGLSFIRNPYQVTRAWTRFMILSARDYHTVAVYGVRMN